MAPKTQKADPTKAKPKPKPKKPAARKTARPREVDSAPVRALGELPALDARLRAAFRAAFTEEQCEAWGSRTEAAKVLREAEGWLTALRDFLEAKELPGYSPRRLAYLAELLVALEDELTASAEGDAHRGARRSAVTYARGVRRELVDRLVLVAGGREELARAVADRDQGDGAVESLRDSLAGLVDLAGRWRREPALELLADDADLTTARLGGAFNALEALTRADAVLREAPDEAGDSRSVNRLEGRVLRELHLVAEAARRAKARGLAVPALVSGPSLRKGFDEGLGT